MATVAVIYIKNNTGSDRSDGDHVSKVGGAVNLNDGGSLFFYILEMFKILKLAGNLLRARFAGDFDLMNYKKKPSDDSMRMQHALQFAY